MGTVERLGKIFFALAIIGLGVEHFIFEDFIIGRAPAWPETLPGKLIWAYLSGIAVIGLGVVILIEKNVRVVALSVGTLIFLWALSRHFPLIAVDSFLSGAWTKAGKALTFWSATWAIAAISPKVESARTPSLLKFVNLEHEFIVLGRICLGIFFINSGIQHFMYTDFVATLLPKWFPGDAMFWTRFGGVALISGGVGLIVPRTAFWAALLSGVMVFLWFWIVHIPRTFTSVSDGIAVFEALAVSGIAFVVAGHVRKTPRE